MFLLKFNLGTFVALFVIIKKLYVRQKFEMQYNYSELSVLGYHHKIVFL